MNAKAEVFGPEVARRIDAHLGAVDRALTAAGMPLRERRDILDDLEGQIHEMLAAQAGATPTVADAEAVLARLDPPDAYEEAVAEGRPAAAGPRAPEPIEPRLSRPALYGALWAPLFFLNGFLYMFATVHVSVQGAPPPPPPGPQWWQILLMIGMAGAGLSAPFGTTVLGLVSISQIRNSGGRLYGLPLAVFDVLLFPLLLLDAVLYAAIHAAARAITGAPPTDVVALIALVACLAFDVLIIYLVWRALREAPAAQKPAVGL